LSAPGAWLALGLGALTLVRLALIGGSDLIPDEAYYFFWTQKIEPCYWDQPAGVAVGNWFVVLLFGKSPFALRFGAVILSLVSSIFAYDLGRTCLGSRTRAAKGTLLAQILPLLAVGAVLILHDAVLGAAAVMTLAFWARALFRDEPKWWYAAGFTFAVALYAKFSAVLLLVGLLAYALFSPMARKRLFRPEPFVSAFLAAVLFSPVIAWNVRNGWVAYYAVAKLSKDADLSFWQRLLSLLEFSSSQVLLVTPILFFFLAWACLSAFSRRKEEGGEGRLFLATVCAGIFFYFAVSSLRAKIQGNWAALAYIPGCLLVVDFLSEKWKSARIRKWAVAGIILAGAATIVIHLHTVRPFLPIPPRADMTAQAHGWTELADFVNKELQSGRPGTAVMARRYQVASELKFYLDPGVDVYCASYASRGSQFDIWQDFGKLEGRDVIYLDTKGRSRKLFLHFSGALPLPDFELGPPGRSNKTLRVFRLENFKVRGPLQAYFHDPFSDALKRLKHRVLVGRKS